MEKTLDDMPGIKPRCRVARSGNYRGLVSATILTLIVLPALYLMFHARPDAERL
jgi:hypothetical protein